MRSRLCGIISLDFDRKSVKGVNRETNPLCGDVCVCGSNVEYRGL